MQNPTLLVEYDEHREAKTSAVVQSLHQSRSLLSLLSPLCFSGIIVHVDVLKVIAYNLSDSGVVGYEVSKAQTPDTPVSAHLTNHELSPGLGLGATTWPFFWAV